MPTTARAGGRLSRRPLRQHGFVRKWCGGVRFSVGRPRAVTGLQSRGLDHAARKGLYRLGVSMIRKRMHFRSDRTPVVPGGPVPRANHTYPGSTRHRLVPCTSSPTYYCTAEGVDIRGYASDHRLFAREAPPINVQRIADPKAYPRAGRDISSTFCAAKDPAGSDPGAPTLQSSQALRGNPREII